MEARGLCRTFAGRPPVAALLDVHLSVPEGGITAVLGPSGCGKTTLLRALAGAERLDAGTIALGDRVLAEPGTHVPPERRRIGLVPQEGALFPHLDVAHNIGFGLHRSSPAERRARVAELLELVGMTGLGGRRPNELSGGQQQRVALARALAPAPELVLLDEPFSALDTGLRASLRDEVAAMLRATGATGILVTHDQAEALGMAERVAVMCDGRVVQEGASADVYRKPVDLWAARFLGEAIVVAGRRSDADAGSVDTPLGRLPLAPGHAHAAGPDVAVFLRPEQVRPSPDRAAGVEAVLERVRFQGPDAEVRLRVGDVVVTARWPSLELPEPGATVALAVTGTAVAFPPD
ncbi:MAG: transporter ATP-binding protein [Acidimicrobiales bacterium]|nr:transporter ATP-binding protein [Acidimicrobiales bacterium]